MKKHLFIIFMLTFFGSASAHPGHGLLTNLSEGVIHFWSHELLFISILVIGVGTAAYGIWRWKTARRKP